MALELEGSTVTTDGRWSIVTLEDRSPSRGHRDSKPAGSPDDAIERIDDIGGPNSHTNYPWGWAQCGNSPFKWYKQNTHEGGVHVPLVVHWPNGIDVEQNGTLRNQFVNVSDIVTDVFIATGNNCSHKNDSSANTAFRHSVATLRHDVATFRDGVTTTKDSLQCKTT